MYREPVTALVANHKSSRLGGPVHKERAPVAAATGVAAVHRLGLRLQLRDTRRLLWFAGIIGIAAVFVVFLPDKDLALSTFLGALVGMLVQWRGTCSAIVEIPADAMPRSMIEPWLKAKGYRDGPSPGMLKFKHPDWACFASQTIVLQDHPGGTRITGPYFILKALARLAHRTNSVEAERSRR